MKKIHRPNAEERILAVLIAKSPLAFCDECLAKELNYAHMHVNDRCRLALEKLCLIEFRDKGICHTCKKNSKVNKIMPQTLARFRGFTRQPNTTKEN
jgi:hypothetical protein